MIQRALRYLYGSLALAAIFLVSFSATSFAATATVGEDSTPLDIAKAIYDAFSAGHYALTASLGVVLLVAVVKRYLGDTIKWLHSDAGNALIHLVGAGAVALTAALAVPDAKFTLSLFKTALLIGIGAAGGYAALEHLIVEPLLRPLAAKAPAWMQGIFNLVFWIFDHGADAARTDAIAASQKAGTAAVTANPGGGVTDVLGKPTELK